MRTKWTVKDVLEHARELKSPFEEVQRKPVLPNLAEKIKELELRNKGMKPQ